MGELTHDMDHAAIVAHLRHEVCETARFETGRLIQIDQGLSSRASGLAFFGAVRAIMCDIDYVAALYGGFDGGNRRQIASAQKTTRFLSEVFTDATGNQGYGDYAEHLYDAYRCGTVHLRAPKKLRNPDASTPVLAWTVMGPRRLKGPGKKSPGPFVYRHLEPQLTDVPGVTTLPVSIQGLFEDFLTAGEYYAQQVEAEARAGGTELRDRWRQTANALIEPEPTSRLSW